MAYRELSRMEIIELVRRWQAGESQRAIARSSGLARETVKKYLQAAQGVGLSATGATPSEGQLLQLARLTQAGSRPAREGVRLDPWREQIAHWLTQDRLQLTRVQELLARDGLGVSYSTLRRFVRQAGLGRTGRTTVRVAAGAPGEAAEMDFGRLGRLQDPDTGKRRRSGRWWWCCCSAGIASSGRWSPRRSRPLLKV